MLPVAATPQRNPTLLCLPNMSPRAGSQRGPHDDGEVDPPHGARLLEVFRFFLWLGVVGVGGPAAHIALMRKHVVTRRGWVNEDDFARMVGACALVPGPNSTEMAMALGARRAGWRGLVLGGAAFILPAFTIVCVIAIGYERLLTGEVIAQARRWLVPVVAAIVLDALFALRTTAVRDRIDIGVVVLALAGAVVGLPELLVLVIVGIASVALRRRAGSSRLAVFASTVMLAVVTPSLTKILLVFLQIGSVIYGSGYVLLVFLDSEVVGRGWISTELLVDAISVGQFTPGPVFTTATFIGWQLAGFAGAVVATIGIFGPSFVFATFIEKVVGWAQRVNWFAAFLRGVSSGSIALMVVVMWRLADEALVDWRSVAVCVLAFATLRFGVATTLRRAIIRALRRSAYRSP